MAQKFEAHSNLGSAKSENVAFNILLALLLNIIIAESLSKRMNQLVAHSDIVKLCFDAFLAGVWKIQQDSNITKAFHV